MTPATITKEKIIERLETVLDPELNIDVWTLGLIYEINIKNEKELRLVITFTTPLCPVAPMLVSAMEKEMKDLGFEKVEIETVFEPPWKPSQELRVMLGI